MKRKSFSKSLVRSVNPFALRSVSSLFLIVIACALLLVSSARPQMLHGIQTGAADIISPAIAMVARPIQQAAEFVRNVSGLAELQSQNIQLQQENARLREWYQMALLLEAENRSLRDLLNLKLPAQHGYITTRVLSDAGNAFVKSVLIEAGSEDGLQKGQAVLSGEGLIGRIVQVGKNTSRVLLVTDRNSRVPVLVENTQQHAILAGRNDKKPVVMRVANDNTISIGARIITSGRGGVFPYGLPIGRIFLDENGEKRVKLSADMGALVHVRIVNKPVDENLRQGILNNE